MRSHAVKLTLAASLLFVGVVHATEQDPIATGSISRAKSFSGLDVKGEFESKNSVRVGFGFSPFLEEGLAAEVPPARPHEFRIPVPAYLSDLRGGVADPL